MDVFMRQAIAREVEDRPEQQSGESRLAGNAGGSAGSHMERDDHGPVQTTGGAVVAWCPPR